jgi:hypothetical protein
MAFEAKIIADSMCNGHRLTTMQLTHPRIVHAEFNTHCMFSRNASSSRAIPFNVTVQRVHSDPFVPVEFGVNQKGMQAKEVLSGWKLEEARKRWLRACELMIGAAKDLASEICVLCDGTGKSRLGGVTCTKCQGTGEGLNVHKQIVNRLIEPWSWITVCVTGDWSAWSNYFALRCHPDAQPEIQKQAYMAQLAYFRNKPELLSPGMWHTPYVLNTDYNEIMDKYGIAKTEDGLDAIVKISVGRCARTSYLTQEGTRDFSKDVELHDRLRFHEPLHASPFEHVCQAMGDDARYGKYVGWKAYRHMLPREYVTDFKPNHPELVNA